MPVFCRRCALKMDIPLPSFRVTKQPCDVCKGYDENIKANYSVDAMQIPGSTEDPNRHAEMEERTA